ncbi:MAG TPA: ATP-binding protein, partial [bacterium]|nr:ATP-binding protein [bacterium]
IEQGKFGGKKANFLSLVHPEDLSTLREVNDKAVRGATGFDLEFRIVRPDGAVRWIHSQSEVIRDAGGHAIKIIGTAQDVTERKEAEKLRHKMERQAALNDRLATVGTLAAGVAHEINNPLTYVMANLISVKDHLEELRGYLVRKNLMDSKLFGLLNELQEETLETDGGIDRIRDIVRSLKTYMHSGGGEKESIDVNKLIDSALNMVFHEIKYKARVEKAYGVNLPPLKANSGKVHQVLINLLMNAVQAIEPKKPDHNRIGVRTGLEGENFFIEIQDTGQGIPEENLKKIFDPFFTTKPAGVGTGLGLSICHQIIREYGGQIRVRSRVGHGSTFTVLLPLTQGIGTVQHPACSAQPLSAHKRILVVDDEPANVDTFGRMLRKDHQVLYALSGLDALNILEREKAGFDAIVSDVNMPDMDGVGLYKNISVKYPGLEKRMVFVTGGVFSTETRDFLKSLSNPLLEKPFPTPDLLKAIAGLPSGA